MTKQEAMVKVCVAGALLKDVEENFRDEFGQVPDEFLEKIGRPKGSYKPLINTDLDSCVKAIGRVIRLLQCKNIYQYFLAGKMNLAEVLKEKGVPWKE